MGTIQRTQVIKHEDTPDILQSVNYDSSEGWLNIVHDGTEFSLSCKNWFSLVKLVTEALDFKEAREWFMMLKPAIAERAIINRALHPIDGRAGKYATLHEALISDFYWEATDQGRHYWMDIANRALGMDKSILRR